MRAALISIGDEILNGTTINTNASWISTQLQPLGVDITEVLAISDNAEHILSTLSRYVGNMDIIVITGGLGPTKDDITKKTLCTFFNSTLEFHPDIYEKLKAAFEKRNIPFTENNRDQAMYPHNCEILPNSLGTAQGMLYRKDGSVIVSLPGVPFEMKGLMTEQVMPKLREAFSFPQIVNRYFMTSGISESFLAKQLEPLESMLPAHIGLAYLPSPGYVKLRLTARGQDEGPLLAELDELSAVMRTLLGKAIFAESAISLEEHIGNLLLAAKKTLGTAESCTGGKIAHKLTSIPGSSAWFVGGVIPYSNHLKSNMLQVPEATINTYGAVSEETVSAMLDGALQLLGTDFAIAASGIAGPTGGTPEKPVGTVWIGVAGHGQKVIRKHFFNKNREINIEYACMFALHELRLLLTEILVKPY
jgi:nicotinamide-nucleotide amidase